MKKLLSLAMAGMLAFSVAACGSNDTPAANDTNVAPEGTMTEGTDNAADGAVIKVGGIGPTTGDASVYGLAVKNAAELAVEEINAAGGINGQYTERLGYADAHGYGYFRSLYRSCSEERRGQYVPTDSVRFRSGEYCTA